MRFPTAALLATTATAASVLPGAYFIELHPSSSSSLSSRTLHTEFISRLAAIPSLNLSIRHSFIDSDTPLFNGLSVNLPDDLSVADIEALPEVKRVFPVHLIPRPQVHSADYQPPATSRNDSGDGSGNLDAPHRLRLPVHARAPQVPSSNTTTDWNWLHRMTGVDKLHTNNSRGAGVKLAVIDTGIDYRHPALGGCFGHGCKVSFGYDFVGDQYGNGSYTPQPKDTPLTTCYEGFHGTHVSGSIIMEVPDSLPFAGLMGVAPAVEFGMYRIFGCVGSAGDDVIMAAMARAADDGAHVISMSLGEYAPFGNYQFSAVPGAVKTLKDRGVAVIAAAGNEGAYSPFYLDSPGVTDEALSVASVETDTFATYEAAVIGGEAKTVRYGALYPFPEQTYKVLVLDMSRGTDSAFGCQASDYPGADELEGDIGDYVVVLRRGLCTITLAQTTAANAGFKQVLVYPDLDQQENVFISGYGLPTPAITADNFIFNFGSLNLQDGLELVQQYNATTGSLNLTVIGTTPTLVSQPNGGKPNNFSCIGPTMDFKLKPQIAAPGGMILSTFPMVANHSSFGIISGTSMATPYLAGVYALVKSAHPDLSIDAIFNLLKTTAQPISMANYDAVSPTPQQGGGLVRADRAVAAEGFVTPGELNLPSTSRLGNSSITIMVTNPGFNDITYALSNTPAAGMAMFPEALNWPGEIGFTDSRFYRLEALDFAADVSFTCDGSPCTKVTVPAGSSVNVSLSFTVSEQPEAIIPIYSGFLTLTSPSTTFTVPYTGPAYDYANAALLGLRKKTAADIADVWNANRSLYTEPQVYISGVRTDMGEYHVFDFASLSGTPCLLSTTLQPVQWLRIDVVRWNTSIIPTHYGYNKSFPLPANLTGPNVPDNGTVGAGSIVGALYQENGPRPEFSVNSPFESSLADVKTGIWQIGLYRGGYRMLQQVLRFGLNAEEPENWETWLGPVIDIPRDVTVV